MAGPLYGRLNYDLKYFGPHTISNGTGADTTATLLGAGSPSDPVTDNQNKNGIQYYYRNTAESGDVRLQYNRLYLSGGAGGEAVRNFTTIEEDCGTARGSHTSLNFAGGFTSGLATAATDTLHIPNTGTVTGNVAASQSEIFMDSGDDDDVALPANHAIHLLSVSGDAGNIPKVKNAFHLTGVVPVDGNVSIDNLLTTDIADTTAVAALRIRVNDDTYYIPLADTIAGDGL